MPARNDPPLWLRLVLASVGKGRPYVIDPERDTKVHLIRFVLHVNFTSSGGGFSLVVYVGCGSFFWTPRKPAQAVQEAQERFLTEPELKARRKNGERLRLCIACNRALRTGE